MLDQTEIPLNKEGYRTIWEKSWQARDWAAFNFYSPKILLFKWIIVRRWMWDYAEALMASAHIYTYSYLFTQLSALADAQKIYNWLVLYGLKYGIARGSKHICIAKRLFLSTTSDKSRRDFARLSKSDFCQLAVRRAKNISIFQWYPFSPQWL